MNMPTETTPPRALIAAIDTDGNMIDTAAPVSDQQREKDFNKVFSWRGHEIVFSLASELYYRDLRTHMNAPALSSYQTDGDFTPDALRILYCSHFSASELRRLRLLSPEQQIEVFDQWIEKYVKKSELNAAVAVAIEINAVNMRARTQPQEDDNADIDGLGN